jgi:hypothetical protein
MKSVAVKKEEVSGRSCQPFIGPGSPDARERAPAGLARRQMRDGPRDEDPGEAKRERGHLRDIRIGSDPVKKPERYILTGRGSFYRGRLHYL